MDIIYGQEGIVMTLYAIIGFIAILLIIDYFFKKVSVKSISRILASKLTDKGKTKEQKNIIRFFRPGLLRAIFPISTDFFMSVLEKKKKEHGENILEKALAKHGMDKDEVKEIPPIFIEDYYGASEYYKITQDYTMYASQYQMTCLTFSDKQVYAYSVLFDTTSNNTEIHTDEYFYKDITNLNVIHDKVELVNPRHWCYPLSAILLLGFGYSLIFSTFSGLGLYLGFASFISGLITLFFLGFSRTVEDKLILRLTVPGDVFECAMKIENIPAVQGMKAKIREKKM